MNQKLERELIRMDAVRQSHFNNLNRQRVDALGRRDASSYSSLCDELGLEPEDLGLYERGQVDLDRNLSSYSQRKFSGRGRVSRREYEQFIRDVDNSKIRLWSMLSDIPEKIVLLKRFGYNQLRVNGKGFVSLEECNHSRIGHAVMNIYRSAKRATGLRP